MNTQESSHYSHHDEVWSLLPWYANGSLGGEEHGRVKAHLRVCLVCRKELAEQAMLARHLRHEPLVEISAKPSFERLMSRIHEEETVPVKAATRKARRPARWGYAFLSGLAPAQLAATCAAGLLALAVPLLLVGTQGTGRAVYHTVADGGSLERFNRNDLRVVFAGNATRQEIDHLIHSIQGGIVDGPSPSGVYTIRLADGVDGGLSLALGQLRGSKSVVFAEPALPQVRTRPGGG